MTDAEGAEPSAIGAKACLVVPVPDPGHERPALIVQWPPDEAMVDVLLEATTRRPHAAIELALERRHVQRRLEHLALHDELTGLRNRAAFFDTLERWCDDGRRFAVCFLDLDGFKDVNDSRGHLAGDEVLRACAAQLAAAVRPGDVLARVGGDEFVVALDGVTDVDALGELARRCVEAGGVPAVGVSASAGGAVARAGERPDAVVAAADAALYEATRAGRNTWRVTTR